MEENIKQLKQDYKNALENATTKEEKQKVTNDYKEMKELIKELKKWRKKVLIY